METKQGVPQLENIYSPTGTFKGGMQMKQRILSFSLLLVLLLAMLPQAAFASMPDYDEYLYEGGKVYGIKEGIRQELTDEELSAFSGVSLQGIAGFNGKIFPSMKDAYEAISEKLESTGGAGAKRIG